MKNHEQVMKQALAQLKINRTNFRKGPSKSICKMLAGGNDEVIADLESALAEPDEPDEPTYCPTCGEEDGGNKPNTDGLDFSNTKPTGCLPPQKPVMPRWVAVFEEEAKKPLSVIGLNRDDIKQAARDYKLMQDLYESVSNIKDAAVRILAEAQGQKTGVLFEPLNLQALSSCIDHHAAELFRLRTKVQILEKLLEQKQ